jgi:hypothetical protein
VAEGCSGAGAGGVRGDGDCTDGRRGESGVGREESLPVLLDRPDLKEAATGDACFFLQPLVERQAYSLSLSLS